jgi:hypothetical protein
MNVNVHDENTMLIHPIYRRQLKIFILFYFRDGQSGSGPDPGRGPRPNPGRGPDPGPGPGPGRGPNPGPGTKLLFLTGIGTET